MIFTNEAKRGKRFFLTNPIWYDMMTATNEKGI
jgi:hypothetical protein